LLPEAERPLVCHQTGNSDFVKTKEAYANAGIDAEVHRFIEDIAQAYSWADLVVCRAGALTVSELATVGIGAILVPYPHAVDDHQTRNAAFLVDSGAAQLIPQDDLSAPFLKKRLGSLLSDRPVMLKMAKAARSVAVDDAAEQVYDHCRLWVKQK
jgi:UDP-N-acetylglucosamine--N-acetylmuramyl-(pentapeptide) pyrophosphoryl-undecaprenol N-acetylglucosamine transferase